MPTPPKQACVKPPDSCGEAAQTSFSLALNAKHRPAPTQDSRRREAFAVRNLDVTQAETCVMATAGRGLGSAAETRAAISARRPPGADRRPSGAPGPARRRGCAARSRVARRETQVRFSADRALPWESRDPAHSRPGLWLRPARSTHLDASTAVASRAASAAGVMCVRVSGAAEAKGRECREAARGAGSRAQSRREVTSRWRGSEA